MALAIFILPIGLDVTACGHSCAILEVQSSKKGFFKVYSELPHFARDDRKFASQHSNVSFGL